MCRLWLSDAGDGRHYPPSHSDATGMSAPALRWVLGLGSYQTAWAWLHQLRWHTNCASELTFFRGGDHGYWDRRNSNVLIFARRHGWRERLPCPAA